MNDNKQIERLTKFLLPIDRDSTIEATAATAGTMASMLGKRVKNITLLHVMAGRYLKSHMINIDFRVEFVLDSKLIRDLREKYLEGEVKSVLRDVSNRIKESGISAPIEYRVEDGDPVKKIVSVCEEGDFSTIVMGRRALSTLEQIFLGSVSAGVLERSGPASVYLVGHGGVSRAGCPIGRTIIALDGSDRAFNAAKEASILLNASRDLIEQVTLIGVIDLADYSNSLSGGRSPETETKSFLDETKTMLVEEGITEAKIDVQVQYGYPAEVIAAEAETRDATMIFMGKSGMSGIKGLFMGSVSRDVIHRCSSRTIALVS